MKIKDLYKVVEQLLIEFPDTRNSDKKLIWRVWQEQGFTCSNGVEIGVKFETADDFVKMAAHPKSIIENRRKLQRAQEEEIQEGKEVPDSKLLIANKEILALRQARMEQKGTHTYRETIKMFNE